MLDIVRRAEGILLHPKSEWQAIEDEPGDVGYLFLNYVAILAAIPAVRPFIRRWLTDYQPRLDFFDALTHAIFAYVLTLVSVVAVAYVINFLAGTFGGRSGINNAMKVAAYAPTAAWLASVSMFIPFLSILFLFGLYSLYLLHTGIATLMRPAQGKALIYTVTVVLCMIVVEFILFYLLFLIFRVIFGTGDIY